MPKRLGIRARVREVDTTNRKCFVVESATNIDNRLQQIPRKALVVGKMRASTPNA